MKTYLIKIANSNFNYIYKASQDPCCFLLDLAKCDSIEVREVERNAVESINEIASIYQESIDKQ
jgi:hypothetical protein